MRVEQVKKKLKSPLDRFVYWIRTRYEIWDKRFRLEDKPWTDDEILQSYRFCNVIRMKDKVSLWLLDNWYRENYDHPNMLYACALARFINKPETLETVGFPKIWNPRVIKQRIRKYRDEGNTVFGAAYMVRGGREAPDKIISVVDHYLGAIKKAGGPRAILNTDSMELTWAQLGTLYGFGSFMAGQVVADLRWAVEGTWTDKNDWAPVGPGSTRGMNRLLGNPLKQSFKSTKFTDQLKSLREICQSRLPDELVSEMELHDWQNCLCEFDKYERVLWNEGKPKQRYQGN